VVFVINYLKGKWIKIGRAADPGKVFKTTKSGARKHEVNYDHAGHIVIEDVWGYFQKSFLGALNGMRNNIVITAQEWARIEWGKPLRSDFSNPPIEKIRDYNATELKLTCRMTGAILDCLRSPPFHAIITKLHGPGPVAKFFFNTKGIAPSKEHIGHWERSDIRAEKLKTPQTWAHHAVFGGRIEPIKMGTHKASLYGYDLCSAYPAAAIGECDHGTQKSRVRICGRYHPGPGVFFDHVIAEPLLYRHFEGSRHGDHRRAPAPN
jgi:hypothetical protein